MATLLDKIAWRITKWFWGVPVTVPMTGPDYDWLQPKGQPTLATAPAGQPVKHKRWRIGGKSRGSKPETTKKIDEFYHRGGYERHEIKAHPIPKAVLAFRGKGFKIERRKKQRKSKNI